jgi:hypothetical protein
MPGIQRQRKFIEDWSGMKIIFGKSNGRKTDAQAQTENSQASNECFEPGKYHCAFKSENRIVTRL